MDRRILYVAAACAGVGAAILLFPDRKDTDAEMAVGRERPQAAERAERKAPEGDLSAKDELQERLTAQRASPFYQHTQAVTKYWMHVGNILSASGDAETAARCRTVTRTMRDATRPNATDEAKAAALEAENQLLQDVKAMNPEGELATVVAWLEEAYQAQIAGNLPPTPNFTTTLPDGFAGHTKDQVPGAATDGPITTTVIRKEEGGKEGADQAGASTPAP